MCCADGEDHTEDIDRSQTDESENSASNATVISVVDESHSSTVTGDREAYCSHDVTSRCFHSCFVDMYNSLMMMYVLLSSYVIFPASSNAHVIHYW